MEQKTKLTVQEAYKKRPKNWIFILIALILITMSVIYSWNTSNLNYQTKPLLFIKQMVNGLLHPNIDLLLGRGVYSYGISGVPALLLQTVAIALVGTTIGSLLAIPFGFLTAKNVFGKYPSKVGEFLLILVRTFPEIVLGLMFLRVFGPGAFTGTVVIAIHSIGMLGKLFAESIENMDVGPIEAIEAVGGSQVHKIRYAIIPQILPEFLSIGLYRLDINIRTASVLGLVAAGGIGRPLEEAFNAGWWQDLSAMVIGIVATIMLMDALSSWLRKKLV
jgi:phosphonate transport system permease protein